MIDFKKIKLIIWDLDETLWEGTLSDNDALILKEPFVRFINDALDRGIVHAICSKNDFDSTKKHMESLGLWDLFVFPSINWEPKGARIQSIIHDMKLRGENVLFVDDNHANLKEAVYYCPTLRTCLPQELEASIPALYEIENVDPARPRLAQYRVLEEKNRSRESFSSNEDFLMSCHVRVDFHEDCAENIDRIHDLILRSNQLNYTKFRQDKAALLADLALPDTKAGYVTVTDAFGDYGIVGFYAIVHGEVTHFLFSCRTLGMLVEQYVYMKIGCPPVAVVGDVITELNHTDIPRWINCDNAQSEGKAKVGTGGQKVLFKGPCDISQIFSFIEENDDITAEFTYMNDAGISVEGHNHTAQLVTALTATPAEKEQLIAETPWVDAEMLDASSWYRHDVIVFSLLTDGNLGIYQHKQTGRQIALCEKHYALTDSKNWEDYIHNRVFTSEIRFTHGDLADFSERYEFVSNDHGEQTLSNLDVLYEHKPKHTKWILLLGSEKPFEGPMIPAYENRHLFHQELNEKVRAWAADKADVHLVETSKYIESSKDYIDTINHFQKRVYYHMAQDLLAIVGEGRAIFKMKGKGFLYWVTAEKRIRHAIKKLLGRK